MTFEHRSNLIQDDTSLILDALSPETTYQAVACRPDLLNVLTISVNPTPPECGLCVVCFRTDPVRVRFEETSVSRLNATHVSLTCRVNTNVEDTIIEWSATIPGERPQRINLRDGSRFDGQRVSINTPEGTDNLGTTSPGIEFRVSSVLVAPSGILEGDVQCSAAASDLGPRRSMPGAFQGTCGYSLIKQYYVLNSCYTLGTIMDVFRGCYLEWINTYRHCCDHPWSIHTVCCWSIDSCLLYCMPMP